MACSPQGAQQDGQPQGNRPNGETAGESFVTIAADEEETHVRGQTVRGFQGLARFPAAKASAMRIRSATGGCV